MYHKAPDVLRARLPGIADQILSLEPEHSNDYYLDATVSDIVAALPPDMAADADEIFVARTATLEPNAEAVAFAEHARVAYVFQGLSTALLFYGYLMRRSFHLIRSLDWSQAKTSGDVIRMARAEIPQLLADPDVALVLDGRKQWIQAVDLSEELEAALRSSDERLQSGVYAINELHDRGEHFVVAHEMAHHLLGHLHRKPFEFRLHPAGRRLVELRHRMGVHVDDEAWNSDQIHEFDADAFAFLALAGEVSSPGLLDARRWYGAIFAALLALPALEDLALAAATAGDRDRQGAHRMVGETHPPTSERIDQIARFVFAFPEPAAAPADQGHPVGLIAQAQVFRYVLEASRGVD